MFKIHPLHTTDLLFNWFPKHSVMLYLNIKEIIYMAQHWKAELPHIQLTYKTRWCGDVSHFATEEPTMHFFSFARWQRLLFNLPSGEHRKQHKSGTNYTQHCKNFAISKSCGLVSFGRQNILDWQKVVCLRKICWRTKLQRYNVRRGRKNTNFWPSKF